MAIDEQWIVIAMEMSVMFGFRLIYGRRVSDKNVGEKCVFEVRWGVEVWFEDVKVSYFVKDLIRNLDEIIVQQYVSKEISNLPL